jgi:hypothetical protein
VLRSVPTRVDLTADAGCYRAIYLDDQGRLDPNGLPNRDLFTGPYAGVALMH